MFNRIAHIHTIKLAVIQTAKRKKLFAYLYEMHKYTNL